MPDRVQAKGLGKHWVFGGLLLFIILVVAPIKAVANEQMGHCGTVACDHFEPNFDDKASLQRGAKYFVNYCMGCHSANFSRFSRVAEDLDLPEKLVAENLILGDQKLGETMGIAMAPKKSKAWFGATPPDLSLETRARSPEWVFTYLRSFTETTPVPPALITRCSPMWVCPMF